MRIKSRVTRNATREAGPEGAGGGILAGCRFRSVDQGRETSRRGAWGGPRSPVFFAATSHGRGRRRSRPICRGRVSLVPASRAAVHSCPLARWPTTAVGEGRSPTASHTPQHAVDGGQTPWRVGVGGGGGGGASLSSHRRPATTPARSRVGGVLRREHGWPRPRMYLTAEGVKRRIGPWGGGDTCGGGPPEGA